MIRSVAIGGSVNAMEVSRAEGKLCFLEIKGLGSWDLRLGSLPGYCPGYCRTGIERAKMRC